MSETDAVSRAGGAFRRFVAPLAVVSLIMGGVLLVYACFVFPPGWDKLFSTYDMVHFFGPQQFYLDYALHHGEVPLWNPLTFCGAPFAANPQVAMFYLPNLVRSLLTINPTPLRTHLAITILTAFHLLLAALGTFGLARAHGINRSGAATAAFVYAFNAALLRRSCELPVFVANMVWLPLIWWFLFKALNAERRTTRLRYAAVCGLALGESSQGGFAELSFYIVLSLFAYWGLLRLTAAYRRETVNVRRIAILRRDFVILALIGGVAAGVAAVSYLPGFELARLSSHFLMDAAQVYPPSEWALFHRPSLSLEAFASYSGLATDMYDFIGSGTIAFVLALAGALHRDRRRVFLFGALFLIFLDCTFGPPFPISSLVRWALPILLGWPFRAALVLALPQGLLAGLGLEVVTEFPQYRGDRFLRAVFLSVVGLIGVTSIWACLRFSPASAGPAVLLAPLLALGCMLAACGIRAPRFWSAVIPALLVGEIFVRNLYLAPYLQRVMPLDYPVAELDRRPEFWRDNYRGEDNAANQHLYRLRPAMNGYDPMHLYDTYRVLSGVENEANYRRSIGWGETTQKSNYGNLFLKRAFWLARQYVSAPLPPKDLVFPATTTVFLDSSSVPGIPEVSMFEAARKGYSEQAKLVALPGFVSMDVEYREGEVPIVFRRLGYVDLPPVHHLLRLFYANTCEVTVSVFFCDGMGNVISPGPQVRLAPCVSPNVLEAPLPDADHADIILCAEFSEPGLLRLMHTELWRDWGDENRRIDVVQRSPDTVVVRVIDLPAPRILTFVDTYYPGWRAWVDGRPVMILRANDVFKAVVVPDGTHEVRFAFRPWRVYAGAGTTVLTVLSVLIFLVWPVNRARMKAERRPADV